MQKEGESIIRDSQDVDVAVRRLDRREAWEKNFVFGLGGAAIVLTGLVWALSEINEKNNNQQADTEAKSPEIVLTSPSPMPSETAFQNLISIK
jgi:hypothetical protein